MVEGAEQFRRQAAGENQGRRRRGWRYSRELRALAASYCRATQAAGSDVGLAAAALGVSVASLKRWVEPTVENAALCPVEILDVARTEVRAGRCVLVTPGGYRVEGLEFAEVERLLGMIR